MGKTSQSKSIIASASLSSSPVHWRRYWLSKAKVSVEDIALREGVTEETVKQSIAAVDVYRMQFQHDVAVEAVNKIVVNTSARVEKALNRALDATVEPEVDETKKGRGRPRKPFDYLVQLKAVSEFRGLVESVQPKGGGFNVNLKNQVAAQASSAPRVQSSGFGFEERLKQIREKIDQNNLLPSEVGNVIDADEDIESDEVMVEGTAP